MSVEARDRTIESSGHAVQFYAHESQLAEAVIRHLAGPLVSGAAAILIATDEHRRAFAAEFDAAGLDMAGAVAAGSINLFDATELARALLAGGRIDGDAFDRLIRAVVHEAGATGRPVHIYGEIVAVLWDAGEVLAAIELEELWNDLGRELPFSLLCGYHGEAVSDAEHAAALERVWHLHTEVHEARSQSRSVEAGDEQPATEVLGKFAGVPDAPRAARRLVADALRQWRVGGPVADDAQLIVSELATNAVVHARTPFSVSARRTRTGVRLSVHDDSTAPPVVRYGGPDAVSGRGLRLVASVSETWGVDATASGKTVWAELRS